MANDSTAAAETTAIDDNSNNKDVSKTTTTSSKSKAASAPRSKSTPIHINFSNMKSKPRSRPKIKRINSHGTLDSVESQEEERILQEKKEKKKRSSKKPLPSTITSTTATADDADDTRDRETPVLVTNKRTQQPPKNRSMIRDVTVEEMRQKFEHTPSRNNSERSIESSWSETSSASKRGTNSTTSNITKQHSKRSLMVRRNKSMSSESVARATQEDMLREKSERSLLKNHIRRQNSFSLRNNRKPTRAYSDRNLDSGQKKSQRRSSLPIQSPANANSNHDTTTPDFEPDVSVMAAVESPFDEDNDPEKEQQQQQTNSPEENDADAEETISTNTTANNKATKNAPPLTRENRRRRPGLLSKSMAADTSVRNLRQRFEGQNSDKKIESSSSSNRHLMELEGSEAHVKDLVIDYESSTHHLSPQGKPSPQRITRKMSLQDIEAFRQRQLEQMQQEDNLENSLSGLIAEPIVQERVAEYKDHWFSKSEPLPSSSESKDAEQRWKKSKQSSWIDGNNEEADKSAKSDEKELAQASSIKERPKLKGAPSEFLENTDNDLSRIPKRISEMDDEEARRSSMSEFSSKKEQEAKSRRQRRTGRRRSSMSASTSSADTTDRERRRGKKLSRSKKEASKSRRRDSFASSGSDSDNDKSRRRGSTRRHSLQAAKALSTDRENSEKRQFSPKSSKMKRSRSSNRHKSESSMDSVDSFEMKPKRPVYDPSWAPKVKESKKAHQERLEKKRHTMAAPTYNKSKKSRKDWLKENKQKKKNAPPAPPPRTLLNVKQRSIDVNDLNYVAPFYERSKNESKMIKKTLSKMVDLATLPSANVNKLVAAFESLSYKAGTEIETVKDDEEYFYIIQDGEVDVNVDGQAVGQASSGQTFGDTHLFHSAKEISQMVARTETKVLRIDQTTYRAIMQAERKRVDRDKYWLIKNIKFFNTLSDKQKKKVAEALKPISFKKGQVVKEKSDTNHGMYIVASGQLTYRHVYEQTLEKGQHGCEEALFWSQEFLERLSPTELEGKKNGMCYFLDRDTFEGILGKARNVLLSQERASILHQVEVLQPSRKKTLTVEQMSALISKMKEQYYDADEIIVEGNGEDVPAALYFLEHGSAAEVQGRFTQIYIENSIIGQDAFRAARKRGKITTVATDTIKAKTACVVGILKLEDYLTILPESSKATDKKAAKEKAPPKESKDEDNEDKYHVYKLEHLERQKVLGEGQFGQVWLVSDRTEKKKRSYALKIQSKFELLDQGQAEGCVREKNVMLEMNYPFVIKLYATFMDKNFVYLMLQMVNGGELFDRIYLCDDDGNLVRSGLDEKDARFYCLVVADILRYIHEKHYVFRDLKPDNVLINSKGYPVLIDFGFAKKLVDSKTYTLCGTPAYISPEMVNSAGHSFGTDHWALGIMAHEMLVGESVFFIQGMDSLSLYSSIENDPFVRPTKKCSPLACDFMEALLQKDPIRRLGSLKGGEDDVLSHPWFDGLDMELIRQQKAPAPWVPELQDESDTHHFQNWDDLPDKTQEDYPPLRAKDEEIFASFGTA